MNVTPPSATPRRGRGFLTVFLKEVRENLRDRRTLLSAFVTGPLLTPILFAIILSVTINQQLDKSEQPINVPVIGAAYAPNLLDALRQGGVQPQPAIAKPEQAVQHLDAELVLRIAPSYDAAWRAGQTAQIELIFDSSRSDTDTAVKRVRTLVQGYAAQQGAMRLVARGLAPTMATPVMVADRDQATAQSRAGTLFNMLPYLFVLTIFIGGMYLAIDLTAGERERQSLEPLFANPVARWKILAGKLAAICIFSLASLLICVVAMSVVGRLLPTEKLGMELHTGLGFGLRVALVELPLIALLASLQSLVAAFAKSYREAQTYLSLLMMLPILPSVALIVLPIRPQAWMYAVPLLGQHLEIMQWVRGESVTALQLFCTLGGSLTVAAGVALVTARLYRSERLAISS